MTSTLLELVPCQICNARGQIAPGTACACCGGSGVCTERQAAEYQQMLGTAQLEGARARARQLGAAGADLMVRQAAAQRAEAVTWYQRTHAAALRAEAALYRAQTVHTQASRMLQTAQEQFALMGAPGPILPPIPPGAGPNIPGGVQDPILIIDSIRARQIDVWGTPGINAPNYTAGTGLAPSGDTSGAKDTANAQGTLNLMGFVVLDTALGPFYIGAAGSATAGLTVPTPGGWLSGTSGGSSTGPVNTPHPVYYLGTGTAVLMEGPPGQGTPHAYPTNIMGGQITYLVFDGSLGGANADGITYGNGDSIYLNRVRVANFGGRGLHELTNATGAYTEKTDINAQVFFCKIGIQFDAPVGTNSHFYGRWNIHLEGCTIGIQFLNSAGIHGGQFRAFGNFYPNAAGAVNGIGIDFSAGVNNSGHFDASHVIIQFETTAGGPGGPVTFQTISFGTNAGAGLNNCTGMLLFADPAWTNSDVHPGQLSFGGYINSNDTTLLANNTPAPSGWLTLSGTAPLSNAPGGFTHSNTTLTMVGLNQTFTPTGSGLVLVIIRCLAFTNTAAVAFTIGARHGATGSIPVPTQGQNPAVGSRINATLDPTLQMAAIGTCSGTIDFVGLLTLTPGAQQWFDLCTATSNAADSVQVQAVQVNIIEL